MALVFDIVRGSFKAFALQGDVQPSMIKLDGLETEGTGYLVTTFQFADHEKVGIIQCFDDYNHVYAFGHDPENSAFAISYTVFLGNECMREKFEEGLPKHVVLGKYLEDRVSKKGDTIEVVFGDTTYTAIVQDCQVASADPEINTASITISGKVTETFTC